MLGVTMVLNEALLGCRCQRKVFMVEAEAPNPLLTKLGAVLTSGKAHKKACAATSTLLS